MFNSDNPIKKFSLSILADVCNDITQLVDLFISASQISSIGCHPYNFIVDDLNLHDSILNIINSYYNQLRNEGILVMNVLGGASLNQLTNAMMHADLKENRLVTRMLPQISPAGLLSIANQSSFKYKTIMSNSTNVNYSSVQAVIQSLREIRLTKKLSNNQPTSRKYWASVQEIFSGLYGTSLTIEVITLFAVK